jgi:hypothetical protein
MGLSRNQLITFGSLAVIGTTVAVVGFGVPLGTLLLIGVLLCCPIMMMGMRGGGQHDSTSTASTPPDLGRHPRG